MHRDQLQKLSKDLAMKLREKEEQPDLSREFEQLWDSWIANIQLPENLDTVTEEGIYYDGQRLLVSRFPKEQRIVYQQLGYVHANTLDGYRVRKSDLNVGTYQTVKGWFKSEYTKSVLHSAQAMVSQVFDAVCDEIAQKTEDGIGYKDQHFHELFKRIYFMVSEFERTQDSVDSTTEFKAILGFLAIKYVTPKFWEMHQDYREANHPRRELEKCKEIYFDIFKKHFEGAAASTLAATYITNGIKEAIQEVIQDDSAIQLANLIHKDVPALSSTRENLDMYVLLHLLDRENFDEYMKYIREPHMYLDRFIQNTMQMYAFPAKLHDIMDQQLEIYISTVQEAIQSASQESTGKRWLDKFCFELEKQQLCIRRNLPTCTDDIDNANIALLKTTAQHSLTDIAKSVHLFIACTDWASFCKWDKNPKLQFQQQLAGCLEACPFCRAPCVFSVNHSNKHSVKYHRPQCLQGYHWRQSKTFVTEICSSLVNSKSTFRNPDTDEKDVPYKEYRSVGEKYAAWDISCEEHFQIYWRWFTHNFKSQLEHYYKYHFVGKGTIPSDWNVSKEEARQEILTLINI